MSSPVIGVGLNDNVLRCLAYTCALLTFTLSVEFAPNVQSVWPGYRVNAFALRQGRNGAGDRHLADAAM